MSEKKKKKLLLIKSPVKGQVDLEYQWPLVIDEDVNQFKEVVDTIRVIIKNHPQIENATELYQSVRKLKKTDSYEVFTQILDKFNKVITEYSEKESKEKKGKGRAQASLKLCQHIVKQVYNASVEDTTALNKYKSFSEEVYGEFNFNIMSEIINEVPITENDTFIDMGSGVGQIVIQIAAQSHCKHAYGIEKRKTPVVYANNMDKIFRKTMAWYGKSHGEFSLYEGDFFDPKWQKLVNKCSVIFVNNYTFGPEINNRLKECFHNLEEGTKIVSSAAFCPRNFRISERNLDNIGCIMSVRRATFTGEGVSWTDKPLDYFIHTIDRARYMAFFNNKKTDLYSSRRLNMSYRSSDDDEEGDCGGSSDDSGDEYKASNDKVTGGANGSSNKRVRVLKKAGVNMSAPVSPHENSLDDKNGKRFSSSTGKKKRISTFHERGAGVKKKKRLRLEDSDSSSSLKKQNTISKEQLDRQEYLQRETSLVTEVTQQYKLKFKKQLQTFILKRHDELKTFLKNYSNLDVQLKLEKEKLRRKMLQSKMTRLEESIGKIHEKLGGEDEESRLENAHKNICQMLKVDSNFYKVDSIEFAIMMMKRINKCHSNRQKYLDLEKKVSGMRQERSEHSKIIEKENQELASNGKALKRIAKSTKVIFEYLGLDHKELFQSNKFVPETFKESKEEIIKSISQTLVKKGFKLKNQQQ